MFCQPLSCTMSARTCNASKTLAKEAIRLILEDGNSVFQLDDVSINRMMVCGKCDRSGIDYEDSKRAFRSSISILADKIDRYNEWGPVPELSAKRKIETSRRYREDHLEEIRERTRTRTIDRRISILRRKGGCDGRCEEGKDTGESEA